MPDDAMHLVVFDCDGTLVDSQAMIVAAMSAAFEQHGVMPPSRDEVLASVGLSPVEALRLLAPAASDAVNASLVAAYKGTYSSLRQTAAHHETLYPDILATLHALHARPDVQLGIATGKSRRGVRLLLERHALDGHFATIQTADTNPSKPSPVMIETALAETGCDSAGAIMIGDTVFDIAMARNAGIRSIGVGWGYHPADELSAAGADLVVESGSELLPAIEALLGNRPATRPSTRPIGTGMRGGGR